MGKRTEGAALKWCINTNVRGESVASGPCHAYMADPQALALSISPQTYCAPSTHLTAATAPDSRNLAHDKGYIVHLRSQAGRREWEWEQK